MISGLKTDESDKIMGVPLPYMERQEQPLEEVVRRGVREELQAAQQ